MIEILVADDQGMMRTLLTGVCGAEGDMTVVAEAGTGEEAIRLAETTRPHVAVIDIKLPGISGLEVTRRLTRRLPETKTIVLTALDGNGFAARALAAGAKGFLTKHAVAREVVRTIRKVHGGLIYVDSDLAQRIALDQLRIDETPVDTLSDREVEVLLLMLRGLTAAEISQTLSLSGKTVEHHRRSIRAKLCVTTDVQLGVVATRYGLDPMIDSSQTPTI